LLSTVDPPNPAYRTSHQTCPVCAHPTAVAFILLHPTKVAPHYSVAEYHFRVHFNGIKSTPVFTEIHPAFIDLNHMDGQREKSQP
jgi:hypothetical protein